MSKPGEIVGIQYIRGIAALGVVVDHGTAVFGTPKYFGGELLGGLPYYGAVGVDLFFLISGFIITVISLRGADLEPVTTPADFFGRRFFRIVPLMWVAVLSYAALRLLGRGVFDPRPYALAFIASPVGPLIPNNIWTLRHEFIFYAMFGLSFLGPRWLRPVLLVWCLSPLLYALTGFGPDPAPLGLQFLRSFTHPVDIEFGLGVLVGLAWLRRTGTRTVNIKVEPFWVLLLMFVGLMVFAQATGHAFHKPSSAVITGLACVPILLLAAHVECPAGPVRSAGLLLGNASYAIYLFHPPVESAVGGIWARLAPGSPGWLVVPGIVVVATAAGIAAHLFIERPLVAAGRRWLIARRTARPQPA